MNVVKEYLNEKTKIRIHDDFIKTEDEKHIKEILLTMMINYLENNDILL